MAGVVVTAALKRPDIAQDVRSGSPGFRKSSTGIDQHWRKRSVTVYLDESLKKLGPEADDAVMQAFGSWVASDPRLPNLSFDRGNTSAQPIQDGKSTVSFAEIKAPGHEKDIAITVTYSNDKTGEILEADIVLNSRYPMAVLKEKRDGRDHEHHDDHDHHDDRDHHDGRDGNDRRDRPMAADDCQNRYDAQNVTTHEVGHFFGLGEDMVEREATMFLSIGQCETHKRALAVTDIGAVSTLYAQVESEEASQGPKGCNVGPASSGAATAIFAGFLGLSLLRRRRSP